MTAPQLSALVISVLALLTSVAPLATDMYLPAFPAMATEFDTSASAVQLTLTTFLIGLALGQLVIGPLSDMLGRRMLLLTGSAVFIAASAACALAPSIELLTAFRFLMGFSGAAGIVLSRAVISDLAEGTAAAKAFSLMMIINGAAPIVAPLVGGSLVGAIGWRGVFWILTALAVAMFIGVLLVVEESHPAHLRTNGLSAFARDARAVVGNTRFVGYTLAYGFGFATMFAYIAASPFVLQTILGLSTVQYSIAFACNAFGIVATSALNRTLVTKFSSTALLRVGIGSMFVFSALFLVNAVTGPYLWPTLIILWFTISSLGLVMANATTLALDEVRHAAGTGSAVLGALQFGLAAVVSPIVGIAGSDTAVPMALTMLGSALIAVVALVGVSRVAGSVKSG